MSDELRLPDELAALEARLAAQSPPAVGLSRDELMYRAGWAACESHQQGFAVVPPPPASRRRMAAWCGVSSALAASLAVAATLLVQSSQRSPALGSSIAAASNLAVAPKADSPTPAVRQSRSGDVAEYVAAIRRAEGRRLPGPVWAMRNSLGALDARPSTDSTMASDVGVPSPKTARELRQELLPTRHPASTGAASPALDWPWSARLFGEST